MVSTLLGGFSAWVTPVTTMTASIVASMASMMTTQRFSVRVIASSETMPSGSGCLSGLVKSSANASSRNEQDEIEKQPADEQEADRHPSKQKRAAWALLQNFDKLFGRNRRRHMFG